MNRPIFTEEERQRQARKLSDGINQAITETFSAGLSENRRKLTAQQHAEMFGAECPMPAEIDQTVCDAERYLNRRGKRDARRVLNILDELDREGRIR